MNIFPGTKVKIKRAGSWAFLLGPVSCVALITLCPAPGLLAAEEESQKGVLEEITVTAQRREESNQLVPIAINAFSGDDAILRGAPTVTRLDAIVPNLAVRGFHALNIWIRGVGNVSATSNVEGATAVYIDGVYQPSPAGLHIFPLNYVERIEVLKGPQGTLFGRNATAGVIQIITPDPKQEFEGSATLGYGTYQTTYADLYVTGGLSDKLAADVAVFYEDQGEGVGTIVDADSSPFSKTGDEALYHQNLAIRSKWLYTPSDSTDVKLSLDYENMDWYHNQMMYPGSYASDNTTTWIGKYAFVGDVNHSGIEQFGASLRIDHDFAALHFSSITSYRTIDEDKRHDNDRRAVPAYHIHILGSADYLMEELQLSNRNPGRIQWLVGAFLYGNTVDGANPREEIRSSGYRAVYGSQDTRSYSAYGQATASLTETTRLTLGLRYTDESYKLTGRYEDIDGNLIGGPFNDKITDNPWTWRVALDHQFTEDVLGYISYNRGFHSGGYNLDSPASEAFYPEKVDAYEVGVKSEFLDHRMRLNVAYYYYDYKDMQVLIVPGGASQLFTNAASSRIQGIDATLDVAATENLTLTLSVGTIDSEFTDYKDVRSYDALRHLTIIPNAAGNELPHAPDFSGSLSAVYQVSTSRGDFRAGFGLSYVSDSWVQPSNSFPIEARTLLSAQAEWWSPSSKPWGVRIWGRNLTDEYYFDTHVESGAGWYGVPGMPREYGVKLMKQF